MTMPKERTRAMLWAGSFLIEVARDRSLPLQLRRQAVVIARHFPTIEDVGSMAHARDALGRHAVVPPSEVDWDDSGKHGPLTYSTRLSWPEDP
ncbi:BPSL0761 family protein [Lysobacter korlensis]|uniref:BPSL0761 family protein n=1 Tax=Lysobacter korlensis TaxID=553636 RepID=A0ABV6RS61_9GAMM